MIITGNTYPVKDQIKALGGRWNAERKGWEVPESNVEKAQALVDSAPIIKRKLETSTYRKRSGTPGICSHCGEKCNPRYPTCYECSHRGQSFTDRNGCFVLGSDD